MGPDDVSYVCILFISVAVGWIFRLIGDHIYRKIWALLFGVISIIFILGSNSFHSLFSTAVNLLILTICPKRWTAILSFSWCFGYLFIFRALSHHFMPLPLSPLTNVIQLLVTLRNVSLAQDSNSSDTCVSFFDKLSYSFSYIGQFTGPFYTLKTFQDACAKKHTSRLPLSYFCWRALHHLRWLPVCCVIFVICDKYFPLSYMRSDEFFNRAFFYRLFYTGPVFFAYRFRLYIAWLLAEAACITHGLGCYPRTLRARPGIGPTRTDLVDKSAADDSDENAFDFETVHNIDILNCEVNGSFRDTIRKWNMTVQFWMYHYIHQQIPVTSKPLRTLMTMTVSAFWHGIHPGYYLAFLFAPVVLAGEDAFWAIIGPRLGYHRPPVKQENLVFAFVTMRIYDYFAASFLLLGMDQVMGYWSSVYFVFHIWLVGWIVLRILIGALTGESHARESPPNGASESNGTDINRNASFDVPTNIANGATVYSRRKR